MNGKSNITVLEITRPSVHIAMMVPHQIFVDDQKVSQVRNGKTQTLEVSPGKHAIYVKQSMFVQSNRLSLECSPGQTVRLQVTQNRPLMQVLLSMTGVGLLFLRKRDNLILERLP